MDIENFTRQEVRKLDFAFDELAAKTLRLSTAEWDRFETPILKSFLGQEDMFRRIIETIEAPAKLLNNLARPPFSEAIRQHLEAQEKLREMMEDPLGSIAMQMQNDAKRLAEFCQPIHEVFTKQSPFEQRMIEGYLQSLHGRHLHPLIDLEPGAAPVYFLDLENPQESDSNENAIIRVADTITPELIRFYHQHPEALKTIDRRKFECFIAELFRGFGYDVELTAPTRDGGKDVIAIKRREVNVKYLIECKRPNPGNAVSVLHVRALLGVVKDENPTKAILVTTTHFSREALKLFKHNEWELEARDFEGIQQWIRSYLNI